MTAHASRPARRPGPRGRRRRALLVVGATVLAMAAAVDSASAGPTPAAGGEFFPLTPARLVHSVSGKGWSGPLQPNATKSVTVTGVAGVPATNVLGGHAARHHVDAPGARAPRQRVGLGRGRRPSRLRGRRERAVRAPSPTTRRSCRWAAAGRFPSTTAPTGAGQRLGRHRGLCERPASTSRRRHLRTAHAQPHHRHAAGIGGRSTPLTAETPLDLRRSGVGGDPASGVTAVVLNLGAVATSSTAGCRCSRREPHTSNASYPRVDTYAGYSAQQLAVVTPDANGDIMFTTNCSSRGRLRRCRGLLPDGRQRRVRRRVRPDQHADAGHRHRSGPRCHRQDHGRPDGDGPPGGDRRRDRRRAEHGRRGRAERGNRRTGRRAATTRSGPTAHRSRSRARSR